MLDATAVTDWEALRGAFHWDLPEAFNITEATCGRHAREWPDRPAVVVSPEDGPTTTVTFADLDDLVGRVAGGLAGLGVERGDRVAARLDQGVPSLAVLLATLRLGGIAVPIPPAFATDAVAYRLEDSGARVLVTGGGDVAGLADAVEHLLALDADGELPAVLTGAAPAAPGHRVLLGHLPGFQLMFDLAPDEDDVYWTPSVWAWQGSLGDLVLPALYFGCPVVATPGRYSDDRVHATLAATGITRAFLATAVLRRLVLDPPTDPPAHRLRVICTGGDPLPPGFGERVADLFGVGFNDDSGLTETSHIAAGCNALYSTPEGAIGRQVPGRRVAVLDADLRPVPPGEEGQIASSAEDPITMLGYWGRPEATAERLVDGWCLTGDRGVLDEAGYLWYRGRMGQAMKVSGQVVGPEEVEAILRAHPCVAEVCVFSEPDEVLGDRPVAVIELGRGWEESALLVGQLRRLAREHLARFAYPRRVVFDDLPRNSSGKVDRAATRERFAEV